MKKLSSADVYLGSAGKKNNKSPRILEELGVTQKLLSEVQKRRLRYTGYALCNTKTDLMKTILQSFHHLDK